MTFRKIYEIMQGKNVRKNIKKIYEKYKKNYKK